jgi:hypothetical protein
MSKVDWIELCLLGAMLIGIVWRWWTYHHEGRPDLRAKQFDSADFSIYLYSSKREQCVHPDEYTAPRA